jgi:NAD(P)H-nitrite reductase large subunit
VALHLGRTATTLDPTTRQVLDDQHTIYTFDTLLLDTGGTPRRLAWDNEQIIYFRTLDDYRRLRLLTESGRRFGVIGGGFIGAEIAAALAMNGKDVVMAFPGDSIGSRVFPHDVGLFLNDVYRQKGVQVLAGERIPGVEQRDTQLVMHTRGGQGLVVDGLVAGLGITPNTALAQAAGLAVDNGIVVDAYLRTATRIFTPPVTSTPGSTSSPIGGRYTRQESSTICTPAGCAACSCGMSGDKSRRPGN